MMCRDKLGIKKKKMKKIHTAKSYDKTTMSMAQGMPRVVEATSNKGQPTQQLVAATVARW